MPIIDLNRYAKNYPLIRLQPKYSSLGDTASIDCCDEVTDLDILLRKINNSFHYGLFKQKNNDVIYPEFINHSINTGPFFLELNTIPSEQLMPYNIDINFNESHDFFNNSKNDIVFKNGAYLYSDRHWDIDYNTFDIIFKGVFEGDVY